MSASSDPTAEKSVNKAEVLAAELMERRAGAKGNVDQQTTCRAQNRPIAGETERPVFPP